MHRVDGAVCAMGECRPQIHVHQFGSRVELVCASLQMKLNTDIQHRQS